MAAVQTGPFAPGQSPAAITWTHLPARSLQSKHFGTEFRLPDGTLTSITTVETIHGLDFKAEFEHAQASVTDPETELMYLTKTRGLASSG